MRERENEREKQSIDPLVSASHSHDFALFLSALLLLCILSGPLSLLSLLPLDNLVASNVFLCSVCLLLSKTFIFTRFSLRSLSHCLTHVLSLVLSLPLSLVVLMSKELIKLSYGLHASC